MLDWAAGAAGVFVALLAEGVDRNDQGFAVYLNQNVALLAEGVDRNSRAKCLKVWWQVALLAEGVDRNQHLAVFVYYGAGRPPRGGRG